jgi:hypothetical protein
MSLDLLVQAYCLWQHSQIPRKKELIGAAKLMVMKRFSKQSPAFFTLYLSDWLTTINEQTERRRLSFS